MSYETIILNIESGQAWLTLNRPDRLNSFSETMHGEIADAIKRVAEPSSGARVLLITGAGRAFCAGQDLSEGQMSGAGDLDLGRTVERYYAPLVKSVRDLPIPVVAVVNGVAAGAGANLALICDLAIAKRSASFLQPFARLGLLPDTGGTFLLPRLAGMARAKGLALLGTRISAEQAAQWGLIWQAVADEDFDAAVAQIARQLATGPSAAYAEAKRALDASLANDLAGQLDLERDAMRRLGRTNDYREGVEAFLQKREPVFRGN
ncbi:2-(1,2-epoxy-1,2-dihydrophenyl)acetyl-CoA isomerase PaaG [Achromobacter denitrificans]